MRFRLLKVIPSEHFPEPRPQAHNGNVGYGSMLLKKDFCGISEQF